jgi:omega-amidase
MEDLRISLIQTALYWEQPDANRANLEEKIAELPATDVIVLPEMFTTGFSMNGKSLAEPMNFTTFKWMKQQAQQTGAVITGSYIVKEEGQCFNRLSWMQPDGGFATYDKRHLFRMGNEHQFYAQGNQKLVVSWKGWNICPLICYDLRFPVWSRNVNQEYDLLLYVANWPAPRAEVWNTLLKARALENQSYVVGVNRVGQDGEGLLYAGDSAMIDFKGQTLFHNAHQEISHTTSLSKQTLVDFRAKFPAYLDADDFEIRF